MAGQEVNIATLTYYEFVPAIVEAVPSLKPIYEEHLNDNDELLPHIFFGDLTRFVQQLFLDGPNSDVLKEILDILEQAMGSSDELVEELVAVSFVENLDQDMPNFAQFRSMLGKNLSADLSRYNSD